MKKMKCESCMESVELVTLNHPKTGESDEEALWIMCECKGYRLGNPEKINYPRNWKQLDQH